MSESTVCVFILTELSAVVLIVRCGLMDSSVQRSAKCQTLINFPKKSVCSDQAGLLYMHFNSAQRQPDCSYATGTNTKKDSVEVSINICIHTYTHTNTLWAFWKPLSAADAIYVSLSV